MSLGWSELHLSCEEYELMRATVIRLLHYDETMVVLIERQREVRGKDVFVGNNHRVRGWVSTAFSGSGTRIYESVSVHGGVAQ